MRRLIKVLTAGMLIITISLAGCNAQKASTEIYKHAEVIQSSQEAKRLLIDGNVRFNTGNLLNKDLGTERREELTKGQKPFAIILSCSDSRVPPELIFDQALGDLFVVRVAGNVLDPITLGSVEYAVEHLRSPYLLVLGHEKCGAVTAAVKGGETPGDIGSIVEKIEPAVSKAKTSGSTGDQLIEKSIDLNVDNVIAELDKSSIIKEAIESGKLAVEGAKYHLDSGKVQWLGENKNTEE